MFRKGKKHHQHQNKTTSTNSESKSQDGLGSVSSSASLEASSSNNNHGSFGFVSNFSLFPKNEDLSLPKSETAAKVVYAWNIKMPPIKKHMVAGHMVPTVRTAMRFLSQKRRKITIEIHGPPGVDQATNSTQLDSPSSAGTMHQLLQGNSLDEMDSRPLQEKEMVYVRVLRRKTKEDSDDHDASSSAHEDDARSVSTMGLDGVDDADDLEHDWSEHGKFRSEEVTILREDGRICEVQVGSGNETVVRDLKFTSEAEAASFSKVLRNMQKLEQDRANLQILQYKEKREKQAMASPPQTRTKNTGSTLSLVEEGVEDSVQLLVEIVSATDLPVADVYSTDPYVIVRMGRKEVHRTEMIPKTLNPIWTFSTGSLFLLRMPPEEFFSCTAGMTFTIKDYDAVGSNELLGRVSIPLDDLLNGTGERIEYDIIPDKNSPKTTSSKTGKLMIRYKEASDDDVEFMSLRQKNSKKVGIYADETFLAIRPPNSKFLKRQAKMGTNKHVLHRVKPFPDPGRPEQDTKWLTQEQIEAEHLKHSTHWVEAGSGDLGVLYFELLRCDGLPNMDLTTLNIRDKTDAFACLVFEDSVVNSDVIGDCCSPRWMPWCRRAFAFNISHPSSDLLMGLFDYDPELAPMQLAQRATSDLYDRIGRVVINLACFLPDTSYYLTYPLFYGEQEEQRKTQRGTVTVRLRIHWKDTRKAFISSMLLPPTQYVSVAKNVDFRAAHYTTEGAVDDSAFSMTTFTKYIEELESYESLIDLVKQALLTVWLWRGHCHVVVFGKEMQLPLHSMTAFIWGVLVTWNFNLFVSFVIFSVGWFMLACNEYVRSHPSPWYKGRRYGVLFRMFVFGKSPTESIQTNQNMDAIVAFEKEAEERRQRRVREKELDVKQEKELREELGEDAIAEDVDITSGKQGVLSHVMFNPLKPVLYPIQKELRKAVIGLRIVRSIVTWEESYYAFWIVTLSFVGAVVALWIPWAFLSRWALRVGAWTMLGPWMKIVDVMFFQEDPNMTEAEREEANKKRIRDRYQALLDAATHYQLRKERAVKLKSMKKYMFGEYLLRVPRFEEAQFPDKPLPSSYSVPCNPDEAEPVLIAERKFGQNLTGDMIPKREIQVAELRANPPKPSRKFFLSKLHPERVPLLGRAFGRKTAPTKYEAVDTNAESAADGRTIESDPAK